MEFRNFETPCRGGFWGVNQKMNMIFGISVSRSTKTASTPKKFVRTPPLTLGSSTTKNISYREKNRCWVPVRHTRSCRLRFPRARAPQPSGHGSPGRRFIKAMLGKWAGSAFPRLALLVPAVLISPWHPLYISLQRSGGTTPGCHQTTQDAAFCYHLLSTLVDEKQRFCSPTRYAVFQYAQSM